jgi:hypothetical protein
MPTLKVQLLYEFAPGTVNGSTESPPADLLGDDGRLVVLAVWPAEPLEVTASEEKEAVDEARRRFVKDGGRVFVNTRVKESRLLELARRQRPGSATNLTSVSESWVAGTRSGEWHLVYYGTPRFD